MKRREKVLWVFNTLTCLLLWLFLLSGFSDTYDIATPAGSDDPAEADDRMREIKAAVQERLNVEHVFDLTGTEVSHTDTGKHTDITCDSIVNAGSYSGTTITASGTLDVAGNIDPTTYETTNGGFLDEDDMASDANDKVASQQSIKKYVDDQVDTQNMTPTSYAGGQSITFPNGLILKMGEESVAGDTVDTITFDDAFPTAAVSGYATMKEQTTNNHEPAHCLVSKTTIKIVNDQAVTNTIYWQACGY